MLGAAIGILLTFFLAGVVWYCIQRLLTTVPIAEPFATFLQVGIILITALFVIWAIVTLLGLAGVHVPMLR